jgi:glyoxylase-like metal-dependent hydrolase (beta-lactamase superfamily II)
MKIVDAGIDYVRYALGKIDVIALRDGYVDMPPTRLRGIGGRPFGADLPREVELFAGKLRLSVNAFLVIDDGQHVLIDTGAANAWEPTMGSLHRALAEARVDRTDIRTVAVTHTHEDHVHGLVANDGTDAFPNLERLYVPSGEIATFDRIERLARFRSRRSPIQDGFKISPRVTAVQTHGHAPGHTAYEVTSATDATLLVWGDIVHVPSIQFARPELTWEYDADQDEARATRAHVLHRVSRPGRYVAGAHLEFPGVGRIAESGQAYVFQPIEESAGDP